MSSSSVLNSTSSNDDNLVEDLSNVYTDSVTEEEPIKQSSSAKHKSEENQVLKLIDNKQKHLEKTLSAAQRGQLLLQEAKDDTQFLKTSTETLRESNRVFAEPLHGISESMTDLGNNFCRSMQMLTQAMIMQSQTQHPVPQNLFFQSPQSFTTPTQQPPYFSSNTTSNSSMANFTSQNLPNFESENEKTYFNMQ